MKAFETTGTVDPTGELRLVGVPYSAGTEVEVIVSLKRTSGDDFRGAWERICLQLRNQPQVQHISDDQIHAEIAAHRAGR